MSNEEPNIEKYDELCRLCASYDIIKMDIFGDKGRERNLSDKITACLPFEVSEDDALPKALCYKCIFHLETFFDFRKGCIKAIYRLEDWLRQSGKKVISCTRLEAPTDKNENTPKHNLDEAVTRDESEEEEKLGVEGEKGVEEGQEEKKNGTGETDGRGHLKRPCLTNQQVYDALESEPDAPNPADFLEACLGDASDAHQAGSDDYDEEVPPSATSYRCDTCGRLFSCRSALSTHAKCHADKMNGSAVREMYPCYVCDKVFFSKGHLALHSRVHIGDAHPYNLQRHSFNKLYACDLCNKSYSMAKHLWGHVSTAHRGHPLVTCNTCLRTFSSIANLDDHRRAKHPSDKLPQVNSEGSQSAEGNKNMEDDKNVDEDSNPKTDDKRSDETSGSRRKNFKPRKIKVMDVDDADIDGEMLPPPCMFCGEQFEEQALLTEHLIIAHGIHNPDNQIDYLEFPESMMESETVFCCEICIREFNDRASLWLHMLYSHRDEASKACGLCLKIFPNNETLIEHVETCNPRGAERRRYSCTVCARQHDSRKKLVAHARIHRLTDARGNLIDPESVVILNSSGYMPGMDDGSGFPCEVCFKPFETEAKMIKHKASAHRETAGMKASNANSYYFVCDLCGLAHSSRIDRWRHMAVEHAGDEAVTCPASSCGKVFASEILKKEHCESHHDMQGVYPSTCEICGKLWNTRVEYWKHMMGVHPDCLPFICGVCLKIFCNLQDLVTHVRANHWPLSGGEHCCDVCGRPYSKFSKMARHRKIHNVTDVSDELKVLLYNPKVRQTDSHFMEVSGPPYSCDQCEPDSTVKYNTLDDLGNHRKDVHNVVPCDLCSKYYGRSSHLWKHVNKIHKGHPLVTCPQCQRTSASRAHLASHLGKHHRGYGAPVPSTDSQQSTDTDHICTKCNKVFRKGSLMRKHLKHCKGPRPPPPVVLPPPVNGVYTCGKCNKTFTAQNTLYKHMKNIHVLHGCDLCEVKVDSKTLLFQHVLENHKDDPSVKCDFEGCDKLLRCKTDLERHKKSHKQALVVHVCKFCAELVPSKVKLRKHLKTFHGNDSKYLCFICLQTAFSNDELKIHVSKNHAAILKRPNTCVICARSWTAKSKLLEHIKGHGTSFHPCKICLKIFPTSEDLREHVENHPGESEEEEEELEDDDIEEVELDESSIIDIIGAGKSSVGSVQDDLEVSSRTEDSPENETSKATSDTTSEDSKRKQEPDLESVNKKIKIEFTCVACDETFVSRSDMISHQEVDHIDIMCKNCNTVSCDEKEHKAHIKICAANISPEETKAASKILESMLTLRRNSEDSNSDIDSGNLFTDDRKSSKNSRKVYVDDYTPSACEICGKVWPAKRHLWQHLIRFHKAEASTTCGVCLRVCYDYKMLNYHLLTEHLNNFDGEGTNLTCRVCGKYHNARAKLNSHTTIHQGQEERALTLSHQCLFCDRTFPLFPKLFEHFFNIHKSEAEVLKTSAIKNMKEVNLLKKKEDINSSSLCDKKPKSGKLPFYTCDICSLVFASEIGLTNHKWVHKNSDKFKCGQCGEVFANATVLADHKAVKHRGSEFICAECKSTFRSYNQLTQHNRLCRAKIMSQMNVKTEDLEDGDTEAGTGEDEEAGSDAEAASDSDDSSSSSSSGSSSSSSDSDDDDDEDDDDEDEDESRSAGGSDSKIPSQASSKAPLYTKSALSESSTSDEEEPTTVEVEMVCEDIVEIVEVDANATVGTTD